MTDDYTEIPFENHIYKLYLYGELIAVNILKENYEKIINFCGDHPVPSELFFIIGKFPG